MRFRIRRGIAVIRVETNDRCIRDVWASKVTPLALKGMMTVFRGRRIRDKD